MQGWPRWCLSSPTPAAVADESRTLGVSCPNWSKSPCPRSKLVQIGPNRSKSVQIGPNRSNSLSVNLYQQHHRISPFLVQPFPHAMQHKITVLLTHTPVSIFAFVDLLELFSTRNGICIEWNSILCQLILH